MGGIVDTVLDISDPAGFFEGLSGKTAAKGTAEALQFQREAAEQERQQRDRAREDVLSLFPSSRDSAQQGFQGALDIFGQSTPMQADLFSQGNLGAQQMISAGLPQIQNALLGLPTDFSAIQPPQQTMPDLSFLKQQLPFSENVLPPEITTPAQDIAEQPNPLAGFLGSGNSGIVGTNPFQRYMR